MFLLMVQLSIAAARKLIDLLALLDRFVLLASDHVNQPEIKIRDSRIRSNKLLEISL
jgi:hypothetical protein